MCLIPSRAEAREWFPGARHDPFGRRIRFLAGEPTVRFVRPDVALAYRDYSTVGHKTPNGQEMPERKTHSTWFLMKDGGKWRISSQVISDDNAGAASPSK